MAINQSLWRLTDTAEKLSVRKLDSEKQLEDFIVEKPEMLDPDWMLIGRQVHTDFKGIVDLLALQPDGTPVIIELKRDRTPREVLAQTLDYASWLEELEPRAEGKSRGTEAGRSCSESAAVSCQWPIQTGRHTSQNSFPERKILCP